MRKLSNDECLNVVGGNLAGATAAGIGTFLEGQELIEDIEEAIDFYGDKGRSLSQSTYDYFHEDECGPMVYTAEDFA